MDFTVEIISQNLTTTSNFVEFRDSRNFTFFWTPRGVWDTWHVLGSPRGAMCQVLDESNK